MSIRKKERFLHMCLLLSVCFLLAWPMQARAASTQEISVGNTEDRKIVRVGFPTQDKITEKNEDGTYSGYTVDYLRELVKYTDWKIEYVEAEGDINTQLKTLSDMLDTGEIDMLGTMNISPYLQELYLYPTYSYGNTYTALTVTEDSARWQSDDFQNWNGMRVASCPALERRMEQLKQYAQISGFTYEIVEYQNMQEVCDAVLKGEADACLQVDINIPEGLRTIARFNPAPYYFALNKQRTDLLKELNAGMYSLLEAYPSLQSELYSRYFVHKDSFQISDTDREWIKGLKPLRVLYYAGNAPIQDEIDGEPAGVAAGFLASFCEVTGLKTEPVFAHGYEDAMKLLESGKVDMVAALPGNSALNYEYSIRLSVPYFESSAVWVTKGEPDTDPEKKQYLSADVQSELNTLKRDKDKETLLDAYCVSYYMRKKVVYDALHVEWADRYAFSYSVGFFPSVDERLVSIINGYISSLSEQTKQSMLYASSREPIRYTLDEQIEVYRWRIVATLLLVIVAILLVSRTRHRRILQENATEIEHLHQFSIMINECIIKYDMKQDRLIMQNSQVVFPNRDVLQPFLAEGAQIEVENENERRYVERLREMMRNQIKMSELELFQEGRAHWFRIDLAYVNEEYIIGRLSDINEEVHQRSQLEREAKHDALTGMMNRSAFQYRVNTYLSKCRDGVFLLMDLDNFKNVNDTMGHREGDKVLQSFSSFLRGYFCKDGYMARLGGDEFVVFLFVQMSEEELGRMLAQFLQEASAQVFADYRRCGLSVSVGAVFVADDNAKFKDLYQESDVAMYVAKRAGKNKYHISDKSKEH